jgi:membrane protein DedA with SNARE-associated domain
VDVIQTFFEQYLTPFAGNPHLGLFLVVWFSAVFPLALPEEAFTLLGGACIAHGLLEPIPTALAILGGIIATNDTQYWMGRGVLGLLQTTRLGQRMIRSRSFQRSQDLMHRKGLWAIVGCRFFFGTRAPTYIAAGFLRFPFLKFWLVDTSVVLLHGVPFLLAGYFFSGGIARILSAMEQLGYWSLALLVAFLLLCLLGRHLLGRRRRDPAPAPAAPPPANESPASDGVPPAAV